jgi:hypothetical protein
MISALRGRRPRPLDEHAMQLQNYAREGVLASLSFSHQCGIKAVVPI